MARLSYRYHAVGYGQDFGLFLAWTVLPLWAKFDADASALELGFLPIPGGLTYFFVSMYAGRLSDRVPRTTLVRVGLVLYAAFCFLAWKASSIYLLYLVEPLSGAGNALVWPCLQAKIADESDARDLERNVGDFQVSWSAGKTCGFFGAALVYAALHRDALAGCGLLALALVPLVPAVTARRGTPVRLVEEGGPPAAVRRAHLHASWWANFAAYGLGSTVNFLYPDLLKRLGRPEEDLAWVLGAMFLAQTASFQLFGAKTGWRYRAGPLLAWQGVSAVALLVIGLGAPLAAALPAAVVAGVGLGSAYTASIYYSLHTDEERGARAGVHEALTGMSNLAVPFVGGALASATGIPWLPYALAAAVVLFAMVAVARILRGAAPACGRIRRR